MVLCGLKVSSKTLYWFVICSKIKTTHWHLMQPVKIDFLAGNCCASDISFLECHILAKKQALKREHKSSRKPRSFNSRGGLGGTVSTRGWFVCRCLQWIRNLSTFRLFVLPSSIQLVVRPYLSKSIFAPLMSTNRTVVQHLYKTCSRLCSWFYCEPFIWIIVLRICRKRHT